MTLSPTAAHTARTPLVRRTLTRQGANALELVEWSTHSAQITNRGGNVAFECQGVEAPLTWSTLAVAVAARR